MKKDSSVLIIYTGGTIGMVENPKTGKLAPFEFANILKVLPELSQFNIELNAISVNEIIDSSNVQPKLWKELVSLIEENYENYDGFVILHGSDTMAYTASALSFMLEGLNKPVILTGSQLPIGKLRTDGKENIITSIEIAGARYKGLPIVNEVCIYFENQLLRGNRTHKRSAEDFDAFESPNYPVLAEVGIEIKYNFSALRKWRLSKLRTYKRLNTHVGILHLFPGISKEFVLHILNCPKLQGLVLYTYGAGNASTDLWFVNALKKKIADGLVILNVSQCISGKVLMGKYETSEKLQEIGVLSGADLTLEAAICKLMFVLGLTRKTGEIDILLEMPLRGEMEEIQNVT